AGQVRRQGRRRHRHGREAQRGQGDRLPEGRRQKLQIECETFLVLGKKLGEPLAEGKPARIYGLVEQPPLNTNPSATTLVLKDCLPILGANSRPPRSGGLLFWRFTFFRRPRDVSARPALSASPVPSRPRVSDRPAPCRSAAQLGGGISSPPRRRSSG